jgi:hypothetical protein
MFTFCRAVVVGGVSYATAEIAGVPIVLVAAALCLAALVVVCLTIVVISLKQKQVPDVTAGRFHLMFRPANRDDDGGSR